MSASRSDALACLNAAFEAGIRHFDVARGYGGGQAEGILGQFVKDRRQEVTITSKFGLAPVGGNSVITLHEVSRPILSQGIYDWLRGQARRYIRRPYSPASARSSFEKSLCELGTDYLDFLLLHEAELCDANDSSLLGFLLRLIDEGKVRKIGVGSAFRKVAGQDERLSAHYQLLQFEHNLYQPEGLQRGVQTRHLVFTHSALQCFAQLRSRLSGQVDLIGARSTELDFDIRDDQNLAAALLFYSHESNQTGKVIFSSTSPARISRNVEIFDQLCNFSSDRKAALLKLLEDLVADDRRSL